MHTNWKINQVKNTYLDAHNELQHVYALPKVLKKFDDRNYRYRAGKVHSAIAPLLRRLFDRLNECIPGGCVNGGNCT